MRKFIIKVSLFLFPLIILAFILEISLRHIPNDYSYKKEYLDKNSDEIETLILGSSYAFYGLNPVYFSNKTFNASHISQSLKYDYEIYHKYQPDFKKLKTIVIPIAYFTMWWKLENENSSWRIKNYVIYYDMTDPESYLHYSEILSNKFKINITRFFSYYIQKESNITSSELGWGIAYNSKHSKDLAKTGENAALRHTRDNINSKDNKTVFDENASFLNKIIESDENIKIILFTPPAYKTYYENLEQQQLAKTIEFATEISENHNNCIYYNFLEDTSFIAEDFYDADHLNEIGARKLSLIINHIIVNDSLCRK